VAVIVPQQIPVSSRSGRQLRWLLLSTLALVGCVVLGVLVGSRGLTPAELLGPLFGADDPEAAAILFDLRLPRTVVGMCAGAALAVAGALMQGHTRNPLADPGLLGVGAGAALSVVLAISVLGLTTPIGYLWFAFGGAAAAAVIITAFGLLGAGRRDSSPASLVLAGAAVTAFLSAITGVILLLDTSTLDIYRFWSVGSLSGGRGFEVLLPVLPFLLVGLAIALAHSSTLDALALGDDMARAMGRKLGPARLTGLLAVTLLVGGAVAIAGSIGFVGLIVPHLVRRITGPGHRWLLPQCAVIGAALVILADIVGRLIVLPAELPVGVVLGVVGAPVFLFLVVRMRTVRS
jgi:iron complex transport system permease protein